MAVQDCRWLQRADSGPDVLVYQQAANLWLIEQSVRGIAACGTLQYPGLLDEDGQFGPLTDGVTRWLQCRFGLDQDGLAGPQTLGTLARNLAASGLGTLSMGTTGCVTPLRYAATAKANQYRATANLPPLPLAGGGTGEEEGGTPPPPSKPLVRQIPLWAWAGAALAAAWILRRRR